MFIIAAVVGYVVGTIGFPNVVLPLLWSLPRARRLEREGKLIKPIPFGTLLLAPVIWGALIVGSLFVARTILPSLTTGYLAGLSLSLLQAVGGLFSRKDVPQMEAAFAEQWRDHLR